MKRIGIFSGSFDPVHKGHVAFALNALRDANLNHVYLAPEVKPRRKPLVSHIAHRMAMLSLAVRSQPRLSALELPGKYFLPKSTMAHIRKRFPDDQIVLLLGSDLFEHLANHSQQWPHVEYLLQEVELAVASRTGQTTQDLQKLLQKLPHQPQGFHVVINHEPGVSSGDVRSAVGNGAEPKGLLPSVAAYVKKHWLYQDISKL